MPFPLHVLPDRTSDAAGNMAVDFLLLRRYPQASAVRWRHYGWQRPAFTFGYGQKHAFVRTHLPAEERLDVTRRASGGGLVDHRQDWTFALVLPRDHPLFARPGPAIYRATHQAVTDALLALGVPAALQREATATEPGVCFARAEVDDVVRRDDGRKIAGAALKRAKHGVLLQGSIWRPAAPEVRDWSACGDVLPRALAHVLGLEPPAHLGWPEFDLEEEQALIDQYASTEWIELR